MDESPAPKRAIKLDIAIPLALFALALLLRFVGIGWGLKNDLHDYTYHPDEPIIFGYSQAVEPAKLKFTPGFYNYGTLYLSVLRVAGDMAATYTGGMDPKKPETVTDFMSKVDLVGRILGALAGAGMVWAVYLILRRYANMVGSAMGASMLAVAPGSVVHSRFQTVDIASAFFVALSTVYALKLLDKDAERKPLDKWALLAGLFAGLSAGTKYTGGLVVLTAIAAAGLSGRKSWLREAGIAVGALLVAFIVTTPGVLLDTHKFAHDFYYEMRHTATGHDIVFTGTSNGFVYHLGNLFVGIGLIATLLGIGGLIWASWRRHRWAWALLAFIIPYYLLIGRAEVKFLRYTFPLYVGLAAGFGWLMGRAHEKKGWGTALVGAGIVGLGGLDGGGLRGAAQYTAWMAGVDPRDAAARYLKATATAKPDIVVGYPSDPWYYSPPLFKDAGAPRWVPPEQRLSEMAQATSPRLAYYQPSDGAPFEFDTRLLTETKPQYVTYSSFESGPLERIKEKTGLDGIAQLRVDRYVAFQKQLRQDYNLDRVFGGGPVPVHDMEYVQPTIYVWKRKTAS